MACSSAPAVPRLSPNSLLPLAFWKLQMAFCCCLPVHRVDSVHSGPPSALAHHSGRLPTPPTNSFSFPNPVQALVSVPWLELLPLPVMPCGILSPLAHALQPPPPRSKPWPLGKASGRSGWSTPLLGTQCSDPASLGSSRAQMAWASCF